jgi:hypothetical protein
LTAATSSPGLAAKPAPGKESKQLAVHASHISTDKSIKYDYPIVYVRVPRDPADLTDFHKYFWMIPSTYNAFHMKPGGDLVVLYPNGREEVLVSAGEGSVADPAVSFDGQWVYYAYLYNQKVRDPWRHSKNRGPGADIFKVHVKTRKTVRLTDTTFTPNTGIARWADAEDPKSPPYGVYNMGPCPVPGGKVVFTSNRNAFHTPKNINPLDSVTQLFLMDEDGRNVEQIGHLNLGGALHPAVLKDGPSFSARRSIRVCAAGITAPAICGASGPSTPTAANGSRSSAPSTRGRRFIS